MLSFTAAICLSFESISHGILCAIEASAVSPAVDAVARAPAQFEALVKLVMEHSGANIFFGDDARRVQNGKPGGGFVPNEEGLD